MQWVDIQSSAKSRMQTVMHLKKNGMLVFPYDLGHIKCIYSLTIAILAAIESIPGRQERILSSSSVDEAIKRFCKGSNIPGESWSELNQRGKGRSVFLTGIKKYYSNGTSVNGDADLTYQCMQLWSSDLEMHCPLDKYNLASAEGLTSCTTDVAHFHQKFYGMQDYLPWQLPRMVLWDHLVDFVEKHPDLPASTLSPILVDIKGNMDDYDGWTFGAFKAKFGISYPLGAIYTCLVGDMNDWYLKLPGVMDHIHKKRREFYEKYGRQPGIPRVTRWARDYIKKKQLLRRTRNSGRPSSEVTVNLIERPDLLDDMRELITADMSLTMRAIDGFSTYCLRVMQGGRAVVYVILNVITFNELFVTPQPPKLYRALNSDHSQGKFSWRSLIAGAKKQDTYLRYLPPLLHVQGFSDARRVKFIRFNDCAQEVCCVVDMFSLLCAWCAVLNAVHSLQRNITKAIDALENDMSNDPEYRYYEGMSIPEIARVAPTLLPGLELTKLHQPSAEDLIRDLSHGPHSPRVVRVGYFHCVAIIDNRIHCSSESYPMELNLANLYHCSDFMDGDLANLCIPEQRVVTFAQDRKKKPKKIRRGNKTTRKNKKTKFD